MTSTIGIIKVQCQYLVYSVINNNIENVPALFLLSMWMNTGFLTLNWNYIFNDVMLLQVFLSHGILQENSASIVIFKS